MITEVLRVAVTDARANWLSWVAFVVTLCAAGVGVTFSLSFLVEGNEDSGSFGGTILGFVLISIFVSSATLASLLINERRATYVKWKLAGMSGTLVFLVISVQVIIVALVSAIVGAFLAPSLIPWALGELAKEEINIGDPVVSLAVMFIGPVICAGAAMLGSVGSIFNVAITSPIKSQRKSVVPVAKPGFFSTIFGLIIAGSIVAIFSVEPISAEDPGGVVAIVILLLIVMLCLTGWYVRAVLQWTRVCHLFGTTALIASSSARLRSAFTSAQVMPWFLVSGAVVGIGSPIRLIMRESAEVSVGSIGLMMVLFGPALIPSLIAGLSSLCVMAPRMRKDAKVLQLSGATPRQMLGTWAWESVVVAVTGGLLTMTLAFLGVWSTNYVLHGSLFASGWVSSILWLPLVVIIGVMALLIFGIKLTIIRGGGFKVAV